MGSVIEDPWVPCNGCSPGSGDGRLYNVIHTSRHEAAIFNPPVATPPDMGTASPIWMSLRGSNGCRAEEKSAIASGRAAASPTVATFDELRGECRNDQVSLAMKGASPRRGFGSPRTPGTTPHRPASMIRRRGWSRCRSCSAVGTAGECWLFAGGPAAEGADGQGESLPTDPEWSS